MEDCTYLFIEVCDKSEVHFIPGGYDKLSNTYIPPMIIPINGGEGKIKNAKKEN